MKPSDEQIKQILALKDKNLEKMTKHQEEIDFLTKNLDILDTILKQSSFSKASDLIKSSPKTEIIESSLDTKQESIQLKKNSDGSVIANAFVSPDQVSIILENNLDLTETVPPLKSFFIDRIIGEMKKKDDNDVKDGKISKESVIDCMINKNGDTIREIIIKNYRQKERVNEIINTATWSLARMIENLE